MNKNVKLSDCKLKGRCEGTLSVQLWRARMSWATHTLHLRLLASDCGSSQKRQSRKRKKRHLEVYSCHTVERGGFLPRLLCSYNHQFSSVVASQPLSVPAVFDTIYLL